jgi:hypothetical protein
MDAIAINTKLRCRAMHCDLSRGRTQASTTPQSTSTKILRLMRHTDSGEYLQAPVVVAGDDHWSGFRPDRIKTLPNKAA